MKETESRRDDTHVAYIFQQSRARNFQHKGRVAAIPEEVQPKLWACMVGIAKKQGFQAIVIGGMPDHVHALLLLSPVMPLAKAIQCLKGSSSKWLHENGTKFSWQEGYGAFSVSASQTANVIAYIKDQKAHHAKRTFEEEFLELLSKYDVPYDPRYVLG